VKTKEQNWCLQRVFPGVGGGAPKVPKKIRELRKRKVRFIGGINGEGKKLDKKRKGFGQTKT